MNRPDFSVAEKQLLISFNRVVASDGAPDRGSLEKLGKAFFSDDIVDWTNAFGSLKRARLLREKEGLFSLSKQGVKYAVELTKEDFNKGFSEHLIKCEESRAHARFCERVYGKNLCQCDLMDMEQLQTLLELTRLFPDDRVLDVGCGTGVIAEHISDLTGAHLVGIDIAEGAIKYARARTEGKRDRLEFQSMDMETMEFPGASFDALIAIDTLYFVENLETAVASMSQVIRPGGRMGIFYSQILRPEHPKDLLLPDGTKLAQALRANNLGFRTVEFTTQERSHWVRCEQAADELKAEFEAEGNLEIYQAIVDEAGRLLKIYDSGRSSRFLYLVS